MKIKLLAEYFLTDLLHYFKQSISMAGKKLLLKMCWHFVCLIYYYIKKIDKNSFKLMFLDITLR